MKRKKLISALLCLSLLLCLGSAAALADDGDSLAAVELEEPAPGFAAKRILDGEDAAAAFPDELAYGPAVYPITVTAGEVYYAAYEDTVYNNGGTVYNNGGLVYNNGGTVYNNDGVAYNNGGIVFANGGEVFTGVGTTYNNGAAVYDYDSVREVPASFRVTLADDIQPFATLAGLREEAGQLLLEPEGICTVTPKAGFHLFSAQAESGLLREGEDGVLSLEQADALTLRLRFQADPPQFDKAPGTYGQAQVLELSAAEGAEIYYWINDEELALENAKRYTAPILVAEGERIAAVAVAEGAEISEPAEIALAIAYPGVPTFPAQEAGYEPEAQPLLLMNHGVLDAVVESVSLEGENADCFVLQGESAAVVKAGERDETSFRLIPVADLEAGSYSAAVRFHFDGGSSVALPVSFTVR